MDPPIAIGPAGLLFLGGGAARNLADGIVAGSAHFAVSKSAVTNVDVDGAGSGAVLAAGVLQKFTLSNLSASSSFGLSVATAPGGSLTVAALKPTLATDTRAWSAVYGTGLGGALSFGSALQASVTGLAIKLQSNTPLPQVGIDWAAIDPTIAIGPADLLFIEGDAALNLADGIVAGSARFAGWKSAVTNVDVDGAGSGAVLAAGVLQKFTLSNLSASSSFGLSVATAPGGSLTVAALKPTLATDTRAWSAVYGTGLGGALSFGSALQASVTGLAIKLQSNTPLPQVGIDWAAIDPTIAIGPADLLFIEGDAALNLADGIVAGSAHFAVSKSAVTNVDVDGAGSGAVLAAGVLQKFTLSNLSASSSFGLSGATAPGGSWTVAGLRPTLATDTRAWSAVYGTGLGGALSFGSALQASVTGLAIKLQSNTPLPQVGIDWAAIDPTIAIGPADLLFIEGDAALNLADGIVAGSARFAGWKSAVTNVDVDGAGSGAVLAAGVLQKFTLSNLSASSSFGLSVATAPGGSLTVAALKPTLATDTRAWSAVYGTGLGGALSFGSALQASVTGLAIKLQSNTPLPQVGIDWAAIDPTIAIGPADLLFIEGDAALNLADGIVAGSAHFAVSKSAVTNVDVDGAGSGAVLAAGVLQKFTLSNLSASSSFGLSGATAPGGSWTVAGLRPTLATDTRAWSAVYGTGLGGALSFGSALQASVTGLAIKLQSNTPLPQVGIDWAAIDPTIAIGPADLLFIEGDAALNLADGIVAGSAHFAVSKSAVTNVDVDGAGSGAVLAAGVLQKFTLSNLSASSSFGLSVATAPGGSWTVAGLRPTLATDTRAWSAVYGTGLGGALSFGSALQASVTGLAIKLQSNTPLPQVGIDWAAIDPTIAIGPADLLFIEGDAALNL